MGCEYFLEGVLVLGLAQGLVSMQHPHNLRDRWLVSEATPDSTGLKNANHESDSDGSDNTDFDPEHPVFFKDWNWDFE